MTASAASTLRARIGALGDAPLAVGAAEPVLCVHLRLAELRGGATNRVTADMTIYIQTEGAAEQQARVITQRRVGLPIEGIEGVALVSAARGAKARCASGTLAFLHQRHVSTSSGVVPSAACISSARQERSLVIRELPLTCRSAHVIIILLHVSFPI